MEELAKEYVSDPSLIWALSIAVCALVLGIIWLVRFILFKMTPVLQNVATSNTTLSNTLSNVATNLKENSEATRALTAEQKLLNQRMELQYKRP